MAIKIYTKTGDRGQTSLLGGTRLPKHHIRIEAYGTVDELCAWIGLLRDSLTDKNDLKTLIYIQDRLFTINSSLASDPHKNKFKIPHIGEQDITMLEKEIDNMDAVLPEMKSFVIPGGHVTVSQCHITRCVCRRAERMVVHLSETDKVDEIIVRYLNRLSDYLFMLARKLAHGLNVEEIPWIPKM